MKKIKTTLKYIVVCLLVALSLVGCVIGQNTANDSTTAAIEAQDITENPDTRDKDSQPDAQSENGLPRAIQTGTPVSLADIPAYDGTPYIQLENNMRAGVCEYLPGITAEGRTGHIRKCSSKRLAHGEV